MSPLRRCDFSGPVLAISYDDGFTLSDAPATVGQIYYPGVKSDDLTLPFLLRVPVTLRVLLTDGRCTGNRY